MAETNTVTTVEDVRKSALPIGTRVVAGDGLLFREVTWATVVYLESKISLKATQAGEVILLSPLENKTIRQLSDTDVLEMAARAKVAAIVLTDMPTPAVISEANVQGIPLLVIPPSSHVRQVEKSIISLLINRKNHLDRRANQIYRQLTDITARNEGMTELVNQMARLTNKTVVVQDKNMRITYSSEQPRFARHWDSLESFMTNPNNLPAEIQDRERVSEIDNPVMMQSLHIEHLARLVCPIITKDRGRGYLSVIGYEDDLDEVDSMVTEHGAAACALEMAKAKAISETEKRLRGKFLDRLLIGDVDLEEAIRQGERLNHDMTRMHIAIILAWRGDKTPSIRRLETTINSYVARTNTPALVWVKERERDQDKERDKESEVVVFHATDPHNPIDTSLRLAISFKEEMARQVPGSQFSIGVGQQVDNVNAWRISYRDAANALDLAMRLNTNDPKYIGDLGVYQLLQAIADREGLKRFCENTLGPLIDYDQNQNAELIKTLEAFFEAHGNLSQTAEALIVHRNTLLYRMKRIDEIAKIDLNRPETRLALHLALAIRRLLVIN